jgi:hypothetical protein
MGRDHPGLKPGLCFRGPLGRISVRHQRFAFGVPTSPRLVGQVDVWRSRFSALALANKVVTQTASPIFAGPTSTDRQEPIRTDYRIPITDYPSCILPPVSCFRCPDSGFWILKLTFPYSTVP